MYKDDSLTLHMDLYQINMMQVYFNQGIHNKKAVFEVYFRQLPFKNGFAVFAGLERIVNYLENLTFSETDIAYLKDLGYPKDFLDYLANLKLELTINSALEGDLVFANEPIFQVEGPLDQCQLVETALLNILNYQILIATKAARIRSVIEDAPLLEFGTRRAQEMDAAIWGTRAAVIGGADATSNVRAGKIFGIPVSGTHAHALVQAYGNDYDAFKAYASTHKDCVFLVDTYDTLKIGVPNAIRVAKELGDKINFLGVRLDSGDLAYLSKQVRKQLDAAGFPDAKIYASNDLDENTILNLKMQKAKIDVWGVGTNLITSKDCPSFGGVYKLAAIMEDGENFTPKIKLSDNSEKITNPGNKKIYRIYEKENNKIKADLICLENETFTENEDMHLFDPHEPWKKTVLKAGTFTLKEMLVKVFDKGQCVYHSDSVMKLRDFAISEMETLWEETKRFENPHQVYVDLSQKLYDIKISLLEKMSKE